MTAQAMPTTSRSVDEAPELPDILNTDLDLHMILREAREKAPVGRSSIGMAFALRARHLDTVLSDATRQIETETLALQGVIDGPIFDIRKNSILFANGDAHRRRRQPLARTFAFKLMEGMRPKAALVAEELIREKLGAGAIDFVEDISGRVPAYIIADILGIPRSDLPRFQRYVQDAVDTLGFFDQSRRAELEASNREFLAYVGDLLDDRRRSPREDFLSEFAAATRESGEMSEEEIRVDVIALIVAGSDTTKNSIAMTLALLLRHPEQWKAMCADPEALKKGATAEGLRYEPVAMGVPRIAARDFDLDGFTINAGRVTIFSIVSASRDPEVYARPDAFDIHRTDHPRWHFAFGGGAHRCLGEALARVEIEETLAAAARLAPNAKLESMPVMGNDPIRAVRNMTISLG
jgi:cytochrome P450 family 103